MVCVTFDYQKTWGSDATLHVLGNGKVVFNKSAPHGSTIYKPSEKRLELTFHWDGIETSMRKKNFQLDPKTGQLHYNDSNDKQWNVSLIPRRTTRSARVSYAAVEIGKGTGKGGTQDIDALTHALDQAHRNAGTE
jgi:hypothetical protein